MVVRPPVVFLSNFAISSAKGSSRPSKKIAHGHPVTIRLSGELSECSASLSAAAARFSRGKTKFKLRRAQFSNNYRATARACVP